MKCSKLTRNKRSVANKQRMANGKYTSENNKIRKLKTHIKYQPNDTQSENALKKLT